MPMKTRLLLIAIILALCAFSSSAPGQGKFPLEFKEAKGSNLRLTSKTQVSLYMVHDKPAELKTAPKELSDNVSYLSTTFGGEKALLLLDAGSDPPRLFVDTDGDGDLSDEKPFEAQRQGAGFSFKNVTLTDSKSENNAASGFNIRGWLTPGRPARMVISPSGFLSAKARLDDKEYEVALMDTNFDGRCSATFIPPYLRNKPYDFDFIAFDMNRNGAFELGYPISEIFPLVRIIKVEGQYYSVTVEPDNSAITFEKTRPEFGALDVGSPDVEVVLYSDTGSYQLSGAEKHDLPAGKYQLVTFSLARTDDEKNKWSLRSTKGFDTPQTFEISPGKTHELKIGPPLIVTASIQGGKGTVNINVSIKGQAGEQYPVGATKNNGKEPPPEFKITDESGKVLESGSLKYG